jgi:hypothetical protein
LMVTSKQIFEKFAPSNNISRILPVISAVIIIGLGGYLVLKVLLR